MSSFRHTMQTHLGDVPSEHVWQSGFGTPLGTQLARFARDGDEVDAMTSTYVAHNNTHHDRMVKAYPGIHEMLSALRSPDRKFAVVTSKNRRAMARGLRICRLEEFFEVFVTTDDVDRHKPHPDPVVKALDRLKADASTSIFVGDSPHDVAAGHAAGVKTAAALWGPFERESLADQGPDFWLVHPRDLQTLAQPERGATST